MKNLKFFLAIFVFNLFVISSISAQSPIPNGCLGVTFGDSPTKVKEIIAKKGWTKGNTPDENQFISYINCSFAGYPCAIGFSFTNKKMYEVSILYSTKGYDTWIAIYKELV